MQNKLNWQDNGKGGFVAEGATEKGLVKYHLERSETVDENGPYFNIGKAHSLEYYYYFDVDGISQGARRIDYNFKEAQARCERDYAIVIDKNQLEWFFAVGNKDNDPEDYANSLLAQYAYNKNDKSEYRIYGERPADGIIDEAGAERRGYLLVKIENDNQYREFNKNCLTVEACEALAQKDFLVNNKTGAVD